MTHFSSPATSASGMDRFCCFTFILYINSVHSIFFCLKGYQHRESEHLTAAIAKNKQIKIINTGKFKIKKKMSLLKEAARIVGDLLIEAKKTTFFLLFEFWAFPLFMHFTTKAKWKKDKWSEIAYFKQT